MISAQSATQTNTQQSHSGYPAQELGLFEMEDVVIVNANIEKGSYPSSETSASLDGFDANDIVVISSSIDKKLLG